MIYRVFTVYKPEPAAGDTKMNMADAIPTHLGLPSNGAQKWMNRHLMTACCESTVWGHVAQTAGVKKDKQE